MALSLSPAASPAELAALTGLSRNTIPAGLGAAKAITGTAGGTRVKVPAALLADRSVGATAKVLYGLLQAVPGFRGQSGRFIYADLCAFTRLNRNTLKRAVAELAGARWIQATRENRLRPVAYTLGTPDRIQCQQELAAVQRRLKRVAPTSSGGEALMQEYLTRLIPSTQFTDNARPGFLVSPLTGERLELDRYYPQDAVAFELNGSGHYQESERFTREQVEAQHLRDVLKAGLCLYEGIRLILIHPEDLTLKGMIKKIGNSMPLRELTGLEPLIDFLEEESLKYRASAR